MTMKHFSLDPVLKRLYAEFLPHKWRISLAALFLLGSASTSSLTATLLGRLTDLGFYGEESWVVAAAPAALVAVSLLYAVSTVLAAVIMARVSQDVLLRIRTRLYDRVLHWPASRIETVPTGLISSKFVNEATIALSGATESVIVLVRDTVQVAGLLAVLFWHDPILTLVTFAVGPALVLALRAISKRVRTAVTESQKTLGRMISRVQESYSAGKLVKVLNTYAFEEHRFEGVNKKIAALQLRMIRLQSLATPLTQFLTMTAVAFVVAVALAEAQRGTLTVGEFMTFLSAMLLMKSPIQRLAGLNATFAAISAAAASVYTELDADLEEDAGTFAPESIRGELVFENVTLAYPGSDRKALDDVTLKVAAGEHLALVGPSGSGKTSLTRLVARLIHPTSGRITLDGTDLRDYSLAALRRLIAVVPQDPVLFNESLRTNLTYGLGDVPDEAIWEALRAAKLDDFVASLPEGLESPAGEGGRRLSGGQRQRLAIARALLKNAPILIFDEATSALDAESEARIAEALEGLTKGKTCLIVSHRLKSVENADRIAVFSDGRLAEIGTETDLIHKNAVYARLRALQSGTAQQQP